LGKKVTGGSYTRVRLDRDFGSSEWSSQFPLANMCHVNAATSDHRALLLKLDDAMTRTDGQKMCLDMRLLGRKARLAARLPAYGGQADINRIC
jgi:hypothetical protein